MLENERHAPKHQGGSLTPAAISADVIFERVRRRTGVMIECADDSGAQKASQALL